MRGFSLLESVATLGLAAILLGVSGQLISDYGKISRVSRSQTQAVEVSQSGLRWLSRQLRRAESWQFPEPLGSGGQLRWRVRSDSPEQWLAPSGVNWSPPDRFRVYEVQLRDSQLVATVDQVDEVVCSDVREFSVNRPQSNLLELAISFGNGRTARRLTAKVIKP